MLSISQGQVLNEETRQSHNHQDTSWGITQHCLVSLHKFRVRKDSPCRKETEKQKLRSPQYSTAHLTEEERLPSWLASGLGLSALLSEKCFSLSYPEVLWLAWFYLAGDPLPFLASWYWNPHQPLGKKEQGRVGENSVRGGFTRGSDTTRGNSANTALRRLYARPRGTPRPGGCLSTVRQFQNI